MAGTIDTSGFVEMSAAGNFSSENWQFFYQSGHYFIRNYDYNASWQLGLTENIAQIPRLYPRSGGLGQQWTVTKVTGSWELSVALSSDAVYGVLGGRTTPMMGRGPGTLWTITINPRYLSKRKKPLMGT